MQAFYNSYLVNKTQPWNPGKPKSEENIYGVHLLYNAQRIALTKVLEIITYC